MKYTLIVCAAIYACAYARVANPPDAQPVKYLGSRRVERDLNDNERELLWQKEMFGGRVFGALGQNDQGLYGRGGYKHEIYNGDRGRVEGQAYGSRVLGPTGDSTHYGGRLDWSNSDAKAGLDLSKQIGGQTNLKATGEGLWNLDKNTQLSAGGSVQLGNGKPDVGVQAKIEHKF